MASTPIVPSAECPGTVRAAVSPSFAAAQVIVWSLVCTYMLGSTLHYLYFRRRFGRLHQRSLFAVLLGAVGGVCMIMTRSYFDFVGREYFACSWSLVLFYIHLPINAIPDAVAYLRYAAQLDQRQRLANTSWEKVALINWVERAPLKTSVTLREWMRGFGHFMASPLGLGLSRWNMDREEVAMGKLRLASYEVAAVSLFSFLCFFVPLGIRLATDPLMGNGCTGCELQLVDFLLVTVMVFSTAPIVWSFEKRTRNQPDPLGYKQIYWGVQLVGGPLGLGGSLVTLLDPGGYMITQQVDWFLFEMAMIAFYHSMRVTAQTWQARAQHLRVVSNVTLLDVLLSPVGYSLFEKAIVAELAQENLLFWKEATAWKKNYSADFKHTQNLARALYYMFIGEASVNPINISHAQVTAIDDNMAKPDAVLAATLFDEALIEVFLLMDQGCFIRFQRSAAFKTFANVRAHAAPRWLTVGCATKSSDFSSRGPSAGSPFDAALAKVSPEASSQVAVFVQGL